MKKIKRILFALAAILLVLLAIPFFLPVADFEEKIELMAAQALGVPVNIGSIQFALLPSPRVHLTQLEIGENSAITATEVTAVHRFASLFSGTKELALLKLKEPKVKKSGVDFLLAFAEKGKKNTDEAPPVLLRRLVLEHANVEWPAVKIPAFDADVELGVNNALQNVEFNSLDDTLEISLSPKEDYQEITLKARKWRLPIESPITFDALESNMILKDSTLQINALIGKLLGGTLQANGTLDWRRGWRLSTKFDLKNISLVKTFAALGKKPPLTGQLFANGGLSASAKSAVGLGDRIAVDAPFKIQNGVLQGVDLLKVANFLLKSSAGGETKFDTFTGNAHVRGKQYKLSNLNVQSGLLGATGHVTVAPSKALSGEVKVEVKNSAKMVAIPMNVSGTLDSPMVFPTKSALIGGALGTAVLPGAGTAAGVQVGEKAEKVLKGLFGD